MTFPSTTLTTQCLEKRLLSRQRSSRPTRASRCLRSLVGLRVSLWAFLEMVIHRSSSSASLHTLTVVYLGRVDPIPFEIKRDMTGLGKTNQDFRMIETTVSQRRGLDSERQQKETEDQRRAREVVGFITRSITSAHLPMTGRGGSKSRPQTRDFFNSEGILLCFM